MTIREEIAGILHDVKPTKQLIDVHDIVEGGYLDSFELMLLISKLSEQYNIEIGFEEISPDNFNSLDAIEKMVTRLSHKS